MRATLLLLASAMLTGCQNLPRVALAQVGHVDLPRFMGDWYVIASIPTVIEKNAYNAVESYRLDADGTIATTFTFRAGGFDGKPRRYTPRGYVRDRASNAVWGMQFIWPIKSDYRIVHLAPDYSVTVIGRTQRDYVWIMARTPQIAPALYSELRQVVAAQGYDLAKLRPVPQRWPLTVPEMRP